MGFAVRVRSAGQKYGPTCHQRDRADVTEFVTLVRLSSLGQHVDVLALAGYKGRKSALTAGPIEKEDRGVTVLHGVRVEILHRRMFIVTGDFAACQPISVVLQSILGCHCLSFPLCITMHILGRLPRGNTGLSIIYVGRELGLRDSTTVDMRLQGHIENPTHRPCTHRMT